MPQNEKKSEDGRAKFVRLAERRTRNAIASVRSLSNLANRSNYDYSEGDAKKILNALTKELDSLRARFTEGGGRSSIEFKL